jgi:hypothetical protein
MKKKILTGLITFIFVLATTPFVLATNYEVELVVPDGKKSKETDAVLSIDENNFVVTPDKENFKQHTKNFAYSDIKSADYSYSKKPMLSGGGAIATAILVGVLVIPFLFMKKKNHWLSVQTEKEFAVLKLDGSNYRAIMADLKTRGVDVKEVKEEDEKKKNDK